jgi:hypothetical protein
VNFNRLKSFEFYLPYLRELYLANNQIEVVNLRRMFTLDFVDLSNNLFKSLNDSNARLEVRDLRRFKMNGSYEFGAEKILKLENLIELDLSFCSLLVTNFSRLKLERVRLRGVKNFTEFETILNFDLRLSGRSLKS